MKSPCEICATMTPLWKLKRVLQWPEVCPQCRGEVRKLLEARRVKYSEERKQASYFGWPR